MNILKEPRPTLLPPQDECELICCVMAVLLIAECKFYWALVTKWREVISMYGMFASRKQVNLWTALDSRALGVLHFNWKYDALFTVS